MLKSYESEKNQHILNTNQWNADDFLQGEGVANPQGTPDMILLILFPPKKLP